MPDFLWRAPAAGFFSAGLQQVLAKRCTGGLSMDVVSSL